MGTWILMIVMGITLLVYGTITYFFTVKKNYFLLNGYENRSAEEKEYIQKSGYLEATGKLLMVTFWMLCMSFILGLLPIPLGFEIGMGVFLLTLLGGLFWVQRYEVPKKRTMMRWIIGSIAGPTIIFVLWVAADGFSDNTFEVTKDSLEVTGSYGDTWELSSMQDVKLLDELPEVRLKTNGTNIGGILKGKFRLVDPYGSGYLFIQNKYETSKVLFIQIDDTFLMISRNTDEETLQLYETLTGQLSQQ
ncbi:MAG TPA: DUF3784 domain-containing protein [Bacillota bacterium]|nr:DUF3784 domain-containing protein [Bacillota bacterium]